MCKSEKKEHSAEKHAISSALNVLQELSMRKYKYSAAMARKALDILQKRLYPGEEMRCIATHQESLKTLSGLKSAKLRLRDRISVEQDHYEKATTQLLSRVVQDLEKLTDSIVSTDLKNPADCETLKQGVREALPSVLAAGNCSLRIKRSS